MVRLLLKIALLFSITALLLLPVARMFSSGYIDPFYTRFTTERAPSLIIGTSRAAQGLLPQQFQQLAPQIQNFAFTIAHSPFGPAYLKLIKSKLDEGTKKGLFIVAVDPWAVASLTSEENGVENFQENDMFTAGIHLINVNPNLEYILRYYGEGSLYQVFDKTSNDMRLHTNGWLEVNVTIDSAIVQQRIMEKVRNYQKYAATGSISKIRMEALEETVKYLKRHGQVYLVRLPVSREMASIEKDFAPAFDDTMQNLAEAYSVTYLNYIGASGEYQTTDGNHLYKEAGKAVSERIASDIRHIATISTLKNDNQKQ